MKNLLTVDNTFDRSCASVPLDGRRPTEVPVLRRVWGGCIAWYVELFSALRFISNMRKKYLIGGLLTLVGLFAVKTMARASYEQAPYEVVGKVGPAELRQYQPFLTATVEADGEFQEAMSNGFMKLAGYIFGGNERKQKIAMTSPVFYDAPESDGKARMSFMVPSDYEMDELPKPKDDGIVFKENPAKLMAALRFSGRIDEEMWVEKRRELMEALAESDYKPVSEALFYGYDPPAVPGPLRRNEVVVEVAEKS